MYPTRTRTEKVKLLLSILLPILMTQLGMYSMNFFDTVMSGHASADDLAGVAIGSSLWVPVFTGLSGILLGITPIVSHLIGAGERNKLSFPFIQALYLAVFMAVLIAIAGALLIDPILAGMDLNSHVHKISKYYLFALGSGIIPLFVYTVTRSFIEAHGYTRITMFITLSALPINIFFNYLFIFGKWGFPELGGIGAGVASAITYWVIALISFAVLFRMRPFSDYRLFQKFYAFSFKAWKEQLKIGVPIGLAIFFETSIFAAVTLLMSTYSTVVIAAHQAALNFASFLYMIPLSISMALTIAVGFEAGAKRIRDAVQYSYAGIVMAVGMAFIFAVCLLIFKDDVALLYTTNATVAGWISHFLIYAIFFQLSDAIAAPIQGALRGFKDVNFTFIMALISYWIIGLPSGYLLANFTSFGPFGYWIGLILGLAAGAVGLSYRLKNIQRLKKDLLFKPGN